MDVNRWLDDQKCSLPVTRYPFSFIAFKNVFMTRNVIALESHLTEQYFKIVGFAGKIERNDELWF
jgi:hypothetical protein